MTMSNVSAIPEGHHGVQPSLVFKSSMAAMAFYVKAFGAKEELCMKSSDGRVQHALIRIGDSVMMMCDENASMEAYSAEHFGGSRVSLMVYTPDCDAMCRDARRLVRPA